MKQWIKKHWKLGSILLFVGYCLHILIETIIVNTIAALTGFPIPTLA